MAISGRGVTRNERTVLLRICYVEHFFRLPGVLTGKTLITSKNTYIFTVSVFSASLYEVL